MVGSDDVIQNGQPVALFRFPKGNVARDAAIYLCREMTGETAVALGHFGGITGSGIAIKHNQIANQIAADRKLKGRLNRIRKKIFDI